MAKIKMTIINKLIKKEGRNPSLIINGKKSIFFALSIFLLSTTLLSISFLISEYVSENSSERLSELSALDRVNDLSISIENSLSEILNLSFISPALISENGDNTHNVTVTENLTSSQNEWSSELEQKMQNFKQFVEERENNVGINITSLENKELPFKIIPHNITYSRTWGGGHVKLLVTPEQINFGVLRVFINAGDVEISSMPSDFGSSGSVLFSVQAVDNYGFNDIDDDFVNPDSNSQVQVFFEGGNKIMITLNDNELEIWSNSPESVLVSTTLGNLEDLGGRPALDYYGSILAISFPELGISMTSPLIPQ